MDLVPSHKKTLSSSSIIEDEGEKFYSPLTKKESNNSSNYSDLDAVRQILVSPDLIASSPTRRKPDAAIISKVTVPKDAIPQNIQYSPLIKDDVPKKQKSQKQIMVVPASKTHESDEEDDDDDDNATIKSSASNISNKTEKALKYEEMKLSSLKTLAVQLYKHTYNEVPVEDYILVLCDPNNPESKKLRGLYLKQFTWSASLLDSLRILCSKLYFRGESQNISRIVESFSIVWTQKFPNNVLGNQYAIYLIAYSLVLLNSDLHSPELTKHISKDLFVKNTLNALKIEKLYPKDSLAALNLLRNFYEDIELNELKLLGAANDDAANTSTNSHYSHNNSSFVNLRKTSFNISRSGTRSAGALSTKMYKHENGTSTTFKDLEPPMIKEQQPVGFLHALQRGSSQLSSRADSNLKKKKSSASVASAVSTNTMKTVETSHTMGTFNSVNTSSKSNLRNSSNQISTSSFVTSSLEASDVILEEDESDMDLELTGPPWAKEGLLKIKKSDKQKGFFGLNNKQGLSNSNSSHFGKNFFNSGANDLSRTSTNTSGFSKSYKNSHSGSIGSSNNSLKWRLNFTVVSRGELKLFSFNTKGPSSSFSSSHLNSPMSDNNKNSGKLRKKFSKLRLERNNEPIVIGAGNAIPIEGSSGIGDGNWMRNASLIGTFSMVSTYSKIVPDDSINNKSLKSKELETFWAIKLPSNYDFELDNQNLNSKIRKETLGFIGSDKILMFSAGTREIAEEYVFTCNYWAARLTAIPTQTESISNKNFGWNSSLLKSHSVHEVLSTKIHPWTPLIPSVVASALSIKKQLIELFKYVQILENLISDHLKLKDQVDEFIHRIASENQRYLTQLNKVFSVVLSNWNNKYNYLVNEHNQFKDYVLTLKEAIDLKQKKT